MTRKRAIKILMMIAGGGQRVICQRALDECKKAMPAMGNREIVMCMVMSYVKQCRKGVTQ